ncbi:MAG: hypothetical protein EOP60_11175 [Sphingomonadales bacterium]|nr:MAG: hypothetical protein EOP60_11175 [Sphingomonadales bacterium]
MPAKQGLARALELAPQDRGLRFLGAAMYLREGQGASARVLLAPLAFQPHAPALAERAQKLVALIDAGESAAALAELQGKPADDKDD